MRRLLVLALTIVMVLSLIACGTSTNTSNSAASTTQSSGTTAPSTDASKRTPTKKIGFLVPTLQSEFFASLADGVKAAFEKEGYSVTVSSYDMDASKANEQIEALTVANVDCIIAMLADNSADSALKAAMDKGIKVVVPGVETGHYDLCLLTDNKDAGTKIGEMAAEYVNIKLGGEAQVIAIVSTQNKDMADRSNSMVDTFTKLCPKSTIVAKILYSNTGEAQNGVENVLQQHPDASIVISYSDAAAIEAINVMKAAGKKGDKYAAFGNDATEQALKLIKAGDMLKGTISMGDIVSQTVDATLRTIKEDSTLPKRFTSENVKITAENVDQFLK